MELNGFLQVFLGGMLGPVLLELIKLAAWRDKAKISAKYSQLGYWIATAALLLAAGIVAVINGVDHVSLQKAVQLGITAPAIVAGYANASVSRRNDGRKHFKACLEHTSLPQQIAELLAW